MDHAWWVPFEQVVQRQAALRTWNIRYMLVTLETSQASGWLNLDAD